MVGGVGSPPGGGKTLTPQQLQWASQFCGIGPVAETRLKLQQSDAEDHNGGGSPAPSQRGPEPQKPAAPVARKPPPPPPKPANPKHTLKLQIRIADVVEIIEENGKRRYDGLFKTMPKDLSKRLIDQVKDRLSFISSAGFQVSVEFGQFSAGELKVPGNIQVWMVDQLEEDVQPGKIMKNLYGYKQASIDAANKEFKDVVRPGPGEEVNIVGGMTVDPASKDVSPTTEPIFIKISQAFIHDELRDFKAGNKDEAIRGIDEISLTTSHEIGHVLRAEPNHQHVKGNIDNAKESFPPKLMDTEAGVGAWEKDGDEAVVRLATAKNTFITKADIDKLGGWPYVWDHLVIPNVGTDKIIHRAKVTPDGGLDLWYNFNNLGYEDDEKNKMIDFLQGLEKPSENPKSDKKK